MPTENVRKLFLIMLMIISWIKFSDKQKNLQTVVLKNVEEMLLFSYFDPGWKYKHYPIIR